VPEDVDKDGYDIIQVPEVAACGVKGGRVRVFTVPALRSATEQPGEFSSFRNKVSGQQKMHGGTVGNRVAGGKQSAGHGALQRTGGRSSQPARSVGGGKQQLLPFVKTKAGGSVPGL
jgi:hypothetical protein